MRWLVRVTELQKFVESVRDSMEENLPQQTTALGYGKGGDLCVYVCGGVGVGVCVCVCVCVFLGGGGVTV